MERLTKPRRTRPRKEWQWPLENPVKALVHPVSLLYARPQSDD